MAKIKRKGTTLVVIFSPEEVMWSMTAPPPGEKVKIGSIVTEMAREGIRKHMKQEPPPYATVGWTNKTFSVRFTTEIDQILEDAMKREP